MLLQDCLDVLLLDHRYSLFEDSGLCGRHSREELLGCRISSELLEYESFGLIDFFDFLVISLQLKIFFPRAPHVSHQGAFEQEAASQGVVDLDILIDDGREHQSCGNLLNLIVIRN